MSIAERMGINVDELSDESDSNGPALHPPSPPFASSFAGNDSDAMSNESAIPSDKRTSFSFLFDDDPHVSSDDETCLPSLFTCEGSRATSAARVRQAPPPAHEPFDECQSHSSVDEGDDGKEIENPLQEESDTESVELNLDDAEDWLHPSMFAWGELSTLIDNTTIRRAKDSSNSSCSRGGSRYSCY
mmetsp:Transcript_27051/g.48890  ORF Transcript_27051/g.48890 Transcript_27051/m.48890 type:complete len:187 (-) Transcript_27051:398-958(-)